MLLSRPSAHQALGDAGIESFGRPSTGPLPARSPKARSVGETLERAQGHGQREMQRTPSSFYIQIGKYAKQLQAYIKVGLSACSTSLAAAQRLQLELAKKAN